MKKWPWVLILVAVVAIMLPVMAMADVCTFDSSGSPIAFLRDGDTTHFLMDGACFVLSENQTLEPCARCGDANQPRIFSVVTTPEHITYGFGNGRIFQWCPDQTPVWKEVGNNSGEIYLSNAVMVASEGVYYTIGNAANEFGQQEDSNWTVLRHDIATGKERVLCVLPATGTGKSPFAAVQSDGSLMVALPSGFSTYDFVRVDTENGLTSTLFSFSPSAQLFALAARPGGGWYALMTDGLYLIREDGGSELINYVTFPGFPTDARLEVYQDCVRFIAETGKVDENFYAQMGLYTVSLTPENIQVLRVAAVYIDPNLKLEFEQKHPGVIVQCLNDYQQFEKVSEALISGSPILDVMVLRSFDGGLNRALDKGYCCDLSDVPGVSEFVSKVYPIFRQEVMRDGRVMALPLETASYYHLGYRAERWEELGLGEVPQTWAELLEDIQAWLEDDLLDGTPLIYGNNSFNSLRFALMIQYVARAERLGETPVFQDDAFLTVMERLQAVKPLLDAHDRGFHEGDPLLNHQMLYGISPDRTSGYQSLTIGFDNAEDWGEPVRLEAAVVNPQSQQQELAKELLGMLLEDIYVVQYYELVDEVCEGIESPYYEMMRDSLTESIAGLEAQLAEADLEVDGVAVRLLKDDLTLAQKNLEQNEQNRYIVSREDSERYRALVPHLALERENGLFFLLENANTAIRGFEDGKLTAKDLARRLDQILQAWAQENQ